jgi:hypothetical protein
VDLHDHIHKDDYRAQPSRPVYIPKPDGASDVGTDDRADEPMAFRPRITHPWPDKRFAVKHPGGSPVRILASTSTRKVNHYERIGHATTYVELATARCRMHALAIAWALVHSASPGMGECSSLSGPDRPMPHKHNADSPHHIPKVSFKVQNRPACGSLTLWIEDAVLECWHTISPSGQARYKDVAIQASLMLRAAFKLPCGRSRA